MQEAYQTGYKVLVIDSLSHAWRELTEEVDRLTQASASKNSFLSWGRVGPKQKRLIDAILNFPGHLIATMRSKTEWVIGQGRNGKNVPEKMGLAPEQGKGIEYEFDLLVELNQEHQASVTKDRTGKFQDALLDKPGEDFGIALYEWLSGETHPQQATIPTATASAPAMNQTPPMPQQQTPACVAERKVVIQAIADVIKQPCFSEAEKDEARSLITSVRKDENGLAELRNFKDFIAGVLAERSQQQAA
jgi:hypothetical protein